MPTRLRASLGARAHRGPPPPKKIKYRLWYECGVRVFGVLQPTAISNKIRVIDLINFHPSTISVGRLNPIMCRACMHTIHTSWYLGLIVFHIHQYLVLIPFKQGN
jgi:hypothetical protein